MNLSRLNVNYFITTFRPPHLRPPWSVVVVVVSDGDILLYSALSCVVLKVPQGHQPSDLIYFVFGPHLVATNNDRRSFALDHDRSALSSSASESVTRPVSQTSLLFCTGTAVLEPQLCEKYLSVPSPHSRDIEEFGLNRITKGSFSQQNYIECNVFVFSQLQLLQSSFSSV